MAGVLATVRIERLARQAHMEPDELRRLLRHLINQARIAQAPITPLVRLVCSECSAGYLVTPNRASLVERRGQPLCPSCRFPRPGGEPDAKAYRWVEALPADTFARAMAGMATLSTTV